MDESDISTREIKNLLFKLNPRGSGNHKDRVRALSRFQNYIAGRGYSNKIVNTPEVYDDDIPLLLLGSESPSAIVDPSILEEHQLSGLYGLLQACGTPSTDHSGGLKRSARNAMKLLKYLVCDYQEVRNGNTVQPSFTTDGLTELNPFAYALCSLPLQYIHLAKMEMHIGLEYSNTNSEAGKRSGAKFDACEVIVLLITRHIGSDGVTKEPLALQDVLPSPKSRNGFEDWLRDNRTDPKKREAVLNSNRIALGSKNVGLGGAATTESSAKTSSFLTSVFSDDEDKHSGPGKNMDMDKTFRKMSQRMDIPEDERRALREAEMHKEEKLDHLGLNLYNREDLEESGNAHDGQGTNADGYPTRWIDSKLAQKEVMQKQQQQMNPSDRDDPSHLPIDHISKDRVTSEMEREEEDEVAQKNIRRAERDKLVGRDPLGIRSTEFDLRQVQHDRVLLMEGALEDLEEEMAEMDDADWKREQTLEMLTSLESQRDELEAILDGTKRNTKKERQEEESKLQFGDSGVENSSILPTDPNFDPLLFLTLVHRGASFDTLRGSMDRLSNKSDDQIQQLQNSVRQNFGLFLRCAEGIDLFTTQDVSESSSSSLANAQPSRNVPLIQERLKNLNLLASSCANQAQDGFKPLLDNADEVRRVQSALVVLRRIAPLLQVPALMRQHIENGRFSAAVKAFRSIRVIGDDCEMDLLQDVKRRAKEAAQDARRDLEGRLADPNVGVRDVLDAARDLGELLELDDFQEDSGIGKGRIGSDGSGKHEMEGKFSVGRHIIDVRGHTPNLACLLLQAAQFALLVEDTVTQTEKAVNRIYAGESLSNVMSTDQTNDQNDGVSKDGTNINSELRVSIDGSESNTPHETNSTATIAGTFTGTSTNPSSKVDSNKRERNRWKYDVLETRVMATIRAVSIAQTWLPRLLRIGVAARESERRRAARRSGSVSHRSTTEMNAFDVFGVNINPATATLVEHTVFCALGCPNHTNDPTIRMSFGMQSEERLHKMLTSPLPSGQSIRCTTELAALYETVRHVATSISSLNPVDSPSASSPQYILPLAECMKLSEEGLISMERRRCIYAFDHCARTCSLRASGSGTFDGEVLLSTIQRLSEELTRPEECSQRIEEGCESVVHRICKGLASYVNDRGDAARLRAVSECVSAMNGRIMDVVREVNYLTNGHCELLEEAMLDDILALEGPMFDGFLDSIRRNISAYTRLGPPEIEDTKDKEIDEAYIMKGKKKEKRFPAYLSASLLAIVRCKAQVEKALGEKTVRKSQGISYQFLAMSTAADSVMEGICIELDDRMQEGLRGSLAESYANELHFLTNTLNNFLSDEILTAATDCRRMLISKAGGDYDKGGGPEGLAAIESLERLGRIYVLCLGDN
eukprot:CAMPEP_0184872304 /NCGR_PEP_ID=MMETSP0580-20130426/41207_1 /TAXON_ID=1118495 /ORGANISM="Dactyliosolen fragilissimus" /LENGTH=1377 /DNA_ID=CAMNT_0027375073 /DNA_START=24 /DNA_END=4157 /DNA_ORIENTATION=-